MLKYFQEKEVFSLFQQFNIFSNTFKTIVRKNLSSQYIPEAIPILFAAALLLLPYYLNKEILDDWNKASYALYFSSPKFLFMFVPLALFAFFITQKILGERYLIPLMLCVSLGFYASWGLKFVPILIASIAFNFSIRELLRSSHPFWIKYKKQVLIVGVVANLIFLAVFKYADFFITSINQLTGLQINTLKLFLPFGISFFTFQEITLAVDTYRGEYKGGFLKYILFVSFFPHLVAGPLVHHREMMPQFSKLYLNWDNLFIGLGLIAIGVFKKVVIADSLSPIVKEIFDAAPSASMSLMTAWTGALSYAFQIYFDFSGYSDMALGLARLFGVALPINFNAPYKSRNIIEFWRCWHITLSRFLREYLYFPLGGNRKGTLRRYLNLAIVMLLGGLWHGASWTFVIWGGLHGFFLIINHGWNSLKEHFPYFFFGVPKLLAQLITFICVVFAWVPFRATSFEHARAIWKGMIGLNAIGVAMPTLSLPDIVLALDTLTIPKGNESTLLLLILFALYGFCLCTPASHRIMQLNQIVPGYQNLESRPRIIHWRMNIIWAIFLGALFGAAILAGRQSVSEFLYWNF